MVWQLPAAAAPLKSQMSGVVSGMLVLVDVLPFPLWGSLQGLVCGSGWVRCGACKGLLSCPGVRPASYVWVRGAFAAWWLVPGPYSA